MHAANVTDQENTFAVYRLFLYLKPDTSSTPIKIIKRFKNLNT